MENENQTNEFNQDSFVFEMPELDFGYDDAVKETQKIVDDLFSFN